MTTLSRARFAVVRSKLFVPGSRPELFAKALASEADSLSFDLEDSVSGGQKATARENVREALLNVDKRGKVIIVRVNAPSTGLFEADCAALEGCAVDVVNIPKLECAADVDKAVAICPAGTLILANIETPKAVRLAAEIAGAHPRIAGLQAGFVDLFSQCRIAPDEAQARYNLRIQLRLAAAEAGVAVFDSAFTVVKDPDGFRAEAVAARRLGFNGKSCIHPSQIAIANEVFAPSEKETEWAARVLQAAEERTDGAFLLDGEMIDKPVIDRALAIRRITESIRNAH